MGQTQRKDLSEYIYASGYNSGCSFILEDIVSYKKNTLKAVYTSVSISSTDQSINMPQKVLNQGIEGKGVAIGGTASKYNSMWRREF